MHDPSDSLTSSTISASSPEMAHVHTLPSVPEAVRRETAAEVAWHSVQSVTTDAAPPSSFHTNVVANHAQARIPNEAVEERMMARHTSMRSTPL